ncbi:MAG: hypothetical protein H7234_05725 [Herminiimonas sp.]|nr:hypothetical protein [Herminiimonas sp.]
MATTINEEAVDLEAEQSVDATPFDDADAAGDWGLFRRRCKFIDNNPVIETQESIRLKQHLCLAYLGSRAQTVGGVYMRARPSVFTPAYVERLAAENASRRFARYPWLERLIELLQQLDHDQYADPSQPACVVVNKQLHRRLRLVPNLPA